MEKQEDILKRVKLLMGYDMSMTLNENLIFLEQRTPTPTQLPKPNIVVPTLPSDKTQTTFFNPTTGRYQQSNPVKPSDYGLKEFPKVEVHPGVFELVVDDLEKSAKLGKQFYIDLKKGDLRKAFRDARDFFIDTYAGAFADIFVSVAGVEVGGPIIMESLEVAFLVNDYFYYIESKKSRPTKNNPLSSMENFQTEFSENIDFQRLIVDIAVIATRGLIRGAGKVLNWLKSGGVKALSKISDLMTKVNLVLPKLGKIGKFLSERLSTFTLWFDDFSTKLNNIFSKKSTTQTPKNSVVSKIKTSYQDLLKLFKGNKDIVDLYVKKIQNIPTRVPKATIQGTIAYFIGIGLTETIERFIASSHKEEPQEIINNFVDDKQKNKQEIEKNTLNSIKNDNPWVGNQKILRVDGKELFEIGGKLYVYYKYSPAELKSIDIAYFKLVEKKIKK
jgi:hypothetical protein